MNDFSYFFRMKNLLVLTALSLFAQFASAQIPDAEAIKKLNADWLHSFVTHDSVTLSKILADDFFLYGPTGRKFTRKETLANVADTNIETLSVQADFVEVHVFNDMGLIVCKTTFTQRMGDVLTTGYNCYMDAYEKRNGHWVAVAGHVTMIPKPGL